MEAVLEWGKDSNADGIPPHPLTRYPNGWFAVARSDDLPAGAVRPVSFMGTEVALFRTDSGTPCVVDAWCIHLGAHLGHGGVVSGERLICPFHGWEFGLDGRCENVPYASTVPRGACLRAWPVRERNGAILVWHHRDGRGPFYEIPDFPTDTWAAAEWHELQLEMHVYDVIENGVDSAHFPRIHGCRRAETRLIDHTRIPLHFDLLTSYPGEGIGVPGEHVNVTTTWRFYGVGVAEAVSLAEDFGMRVRQLFHFTPVGDQVHFRMAVAADTTTVPEELRKFVAGANGQLARDNLLEDAPIWKHKRFNARPKLSDCDGPIGAMRQWACQFFPELVEFVSPNVSPNKRAS